MRTIGKMEDEGVRTFDLSAMIGRGDFVVSTEDVNEYPAGTTFWVGGYASPPH